MSDNGCKNCSMQWMRAEFTEKFAREQQARADRLEALLRRCVPHLRVIKAEQDSWKQHVERMNHQFAMSNDLRPEDDPNATFDCEMD